MAERNAAAQDPLFQTEVIPGMAAQWCGAAPEEYRRKTIPAFRGKGVWKIG